MNTDEATYESPYNDIFKWFENKGLLRVRINPKNTPLCMAMLWRLKPVFEVDTDAKPEYSHVICRDIDSVCTVREYEMVKQWIEEDKTIHCITDSVSHTIPMMGGMVGFNPKYFKMRMEVNTFDELLKNKSKYDFSIKGMDQHFMNREIYPKACDSATEHFIRGMNWNKNEEDGRHYHDAPKDDSFSDELRTINLVVGHVGAAGYYEAQMMKFLSDVDKYEKEYKELETTFKDVCYWRA